MISDDIVTKANRKVAKKMFEESAKINLMLTGTPTPLSTNSPLDSNSFNGRHMSRRETKNRLSKSTTNSPRLSNQNQKKRFWFLRR